MRAFPVSLFSLAAAATVLQKTTGQGTRAKKETAKQGTERQPMPIANSTVNHTPAHSQITQPRTGTGPDGWSGCSTARRYHNSQYLAYTRTVHSTPGLRTYCRSTGRRAQWPFASKSKQASRVLMCACACAPAPKVWHLLTLTLPIWRLWADYIHPPPFIRWFKVGRVPGQNAAAQNMPWRLFSLLLAVIVRRLRAMNGQVEREGQSTQN